MTILTLPDISKIEGEIFMAKTVSDKFFSLSAIKPREENKGGSLTCVTSKEMAGLVNISFANLQLKEQGLLKPLWHTNANKVGYCIQGKGLVSLRTPDRLEIFTVEEGEIFFIPQGCVHQIQNNDEADCIINFALDHTDPDVMFFSQAISSISDSVFNSTFSTPAGFVNGLPKSKNEELILWLPLSKKIPGAQSSQYKFNIEKSDKAILTKGGYVQLGTQTNLPVLHGLGILGFGLNPKGAVEPHWHTNAGELVYIVKGQTRITVLSPDSKVEVLEVSGGEGAFAPASHFHNIENIGTEEVQVIAFFSHAQPNYIGIGEVLGSYPNEELAAIFNVAPNFFDRCKKPQGPLVIVPI
jgi:oxalate decarboxylase